MENRRIYMTEFEDVLNVPADVDHEADKSFLHAHLEAIIGGYYVQGTEPECWWKIWHSDNADPDGFCEEVLHSGQHIAWVNL